MKIVVIVCVVISIIETVVLFVFGYKIKKQNDDIYQLCSENNILENEVEKIKATDKIKSENRREANEKLDNLHSGDSISNAVNILRNKN